MLQTEAEVEVLNIQINADGVEETKGSIRGLSEVLKALKEIGDVTRPAAIKPPPGYDEAISGIIASAKTLNNYEQENGRGLLNLRDRFTELAESLRGFDNVRNSGFKSVFDEISKVIESASKASDLEKVTSVLSTLPSIINSCKEEDGEAFKTVALRMVEGLRELSKIDDVGKVNKNLKQFSKTLDSYSSLNTSGFANTVDTVYQELPKLDADENAKSLGKLTSSLSRLQKVLNDFNSIKLSGFEGNLPQLTKVMENVARLNDMPNAAEVGKLFNSLAILREVVDSYKNIDDKSFKAYVHEVVDGLKELSSVKDIGKLNNKFRGLRKIMISYGELDIEGFKDTIETISGVLPKLDGERNVDSIRKLLREISRLPAMIEQFNSLKLEGLRNASREIEKMIDIIKKLNDVPNLKDFIASVKKLAKIDAEQRGGKVGPEIPDTPDLSAKLAENAGLIDRLKNKFLGLKDTIVTTMPKSVAALAWFGDKAKNALGKVGSVIKKVGIKLRSMIIYRALGAMVSFVTKSLKEGMNNLYQYSKVSNGVFSQNMDKIASSTMYVKNAFGSLLGALIQKAAPYMEYIMDKIGDCINGIRKFYAELTGAESWTRAKKIPVEFAEATENAVDSTEKLKRSILGFDKLNILDFGSQLEKASKAKPPSKPKYSTMFEEVKIELDDKGKLSKTQNRFKDLNQAIKGCAGELKEYTGRLFSKENRKSILDSSLKAAEGLFKALEGVVKLLNSLKVPELFGTALSEALTAVAGIANGIKITGGFLANPLKFAGKYFNMTWANEHPKEWADMMYISDKFFTKEELINIAKGNPHKPRPEEAKYTELNKRYNKLSGFSMTDNMHVFNLQTSYNMALRTPETINKINKEFEDIIRKRENEILSTFDKEYKRVIDSKIPLNKFPKLNSLLLEGRKYRNKAPVPDAAALIDITKKVRTEINKAINQKKGTGVTIPTLSQAREFFNQPVKVNQQPMIIQTTANVTDSNFQNAARRNIEKRGGGQAW